jgi:K+-transporting ATPase KdpF subunit
MRACAATPESAAMTSQFILAGAVALGLLLYLVAVLIRPERF